MQKLDLINGPVSYPGVAEVRPGNDGGLLFSRLPQADRHLHAEMMRYIVRVTSGVRAAFRTDASTLVVGAETNVFRMNAVDEATSIDVLVDGVVSASVRSADGWWEFSLPGRIAEIEVWLPHDATTRLISLEVNEDAVVEGAHADPRPRWTHYGSSISQCGEASSPNATWPAIAASLGGWSLTSLGFGGQCHLDPYVARHIAATPADRISMKVGINIAGAASMNKRTFEPVPQGFLDVVREGHPSTEIVVASPVWCPFLETRSGPIQVNASGVFENAGWPEDETSLNLVWMRDCIAEVVAGRTARGDENLRYLDGLDLFSEADAADLPDDLHPNAAGYARMGERWHGLVG